MDRGQSTAALGHAYNDLQGVFSNLYRNNNPFKWDTVGSDYYALLGTAEFFSSSELAVDASSARSDDKQAQGKGSHGDITQVEGGANSCSSEVRHQVLEDGDRRSRPRRRKELDIDKVSAACFPSHSVG